MTRNPNFKRLLITAIQCCLLRATCKRILVFLTTDEPKSSASNVPWFSAATSSSECRKSGSPRTARRDEGRLLWRRLGLEKVLASAKNGDNEPSQSSSLVSMSVFRILHPLNFRITSTHYVGDEAKAATFLFFFLHSVHCTELSQKKKKINTVSTWSYFVFFLRPCSRRPIASLLG